MSDANRDEIAKLQALYEEHPEGRIFTHLAEAYRKSGELERAHDVLSEGLERHPDYSSARVVLGRILMDQDRDGEAADEFRRVLELDPHNLIAIRALGDIARSRGDEAEALEYYHRLLEQEPDEEVEGVVEELSAGAATAGGYEEERSEASLEPSGAGSEYGAVDLQPDREVEEPAGVEGFEEPAGVEGFEEPAGVEGLEEPAGMEGFEESTDMEGLEEPAGVEGLEGLDVPSEVDLGDSTFQVGGRESTSMGMSGEELEAEESELPTGEEEQPDAGAAMSGEEPEAGEVRTETIAQVYARQGLYDRAAEVYRELVRARPDEPELEARLAEMEELARSQGSEEEPSVVEESWSPGSAEPDTADEGIAGLEAEAPDESAAEEVGAGTAGIEGFQPGEVDMSAAEEVPVEGLEPEESDPDTGLTADAPPELATSEDLSDELGVTDVPEPPEETPWEVPETPSETDRGSGAEPLPGLESEEVGAGPGSDEDTVWTDEPWGEDAEEATPHAWVEEEAEDESRPVGEYLRGLLDWDGSAGAGAGPEETTPPGEPAAGPERAGSGPGAASAPSGEETLSSGPEQPPGGDDDLDMFRSWLESLKQ